MARCRCARFVLGFSLVVALAVSASAGDWAQWRGPAGIGVADEKNVPLEWSTSANVKWSVTLPEDGNGSPIVVAGKVFLATPLQKGKQRMLVCYDRGNGEELWRKTVEHDAPEAMHGTNPHCSPTPASDGERVVVWHGSAGLCCYDLDGKELWTKDLGKFDHIWGYGSSPVIHGDLVLLNAGPGTTSFVAAFNKTTGEEAWRKVFPSMQSKTPGEYVGSWSTPVVFRQGDETLVLLSLPKTLWAVKPESGEVVWQCAGLGNLVYTSPIVEGDVAVAMGGFHGPALACRTGGTGDVTETHRLWLHNQRNPQRIGTGVAVDGHIYILNADGVAWCLDTKSGERKWEGRLGESWGSMSHVDGRLYVQTMRGTTFVLAADPAEMRTLAENPLGQGSRSTPAFSDGNVFVRTFRALYCIEAAK